MATLSRAKLGISPESSGPDLAAPEPMGIESQTAVQGQV